MPNDSATLTDEITFDLYSTANGKDYHEIVKNGVPTQKFVETTEGASASAVRTAYDSGAIVG